MSRVYNFSAGPAVLPLSLIHIQMCIRDSFKSLENSILKKIDTEVINIDGEKVKYLYESGYDGLIAAYNMCKYSVEELPDIEDYIEKNIDKIAQNETVKNVVIENYLKDLDEMKMPLVFKDEDGYTCLLYTSRPFERDSRRYI